MVERSATGTFIVKDGDCSVVVDDRPWPIVFATWFGEPTERLVELYFECHRGVLDRARTRGDRLVLVTDTFATERPSPKARKLIADLTAAQPKDVATITLRSYLVIESALMRGVVTALAWIYPAMAESENVASPAVAIERALAALDQAGIPRPKGLTPHDYRRPTRP